MSEYKFGLAGYGLYLPGDFETAAQIAERAGITEDEVKALGIDRKCRPGSEDQPVTMAVKAAAEAFANFSVKPEEVDLVIWTGEEYKDFLCQTASIRLQEETGCLNAWAYDLVGQGVTSVQGLRVARDMMIGDTSINTVLLAGGTRNVDLVDYANPDTRFLLATSASGGAMILKRNHPENLLINAALASDPEMADEVFVPGGGTEIPFAADNLGTAIMFYQAAHPRILAAYLEERWADRLAGIVKKAASGQAPDYLALRHLTPADRDKVLGELGVSPDRSASLSEWGHHGTNDVIISLDLGIKSGAVKNGDLVAMAAGGIGFNYGAAIFSWGPN